MRELGFYVKQYDNERAESIKEKLKKYASANQFPVNCFGLAFMTHGREKGELAAYDSYLKLQDLVDIIKDKDHLVGKPKLFFIQGLSYSMTHITVAHQKVLPLKVLRFLKNPKPPYIPKCTILSKKCYLFLKTSEQNCNTF